MTPDPVNAPAAPAPASVPPPLPGSNPASFAAAADALGPPTAELQGKEVTGKAPIWRILLYPDRLRLLPPDGSLPYDVHRPEAEEKVELLDALVVPRVMSVKLNKKVPIRLERPAFDAVEAWFGRERLMRVTLKRRLAWLPPIAVILLLAGLPWPATGGLPESGKPLGPVTLGLGVGFALLWVLWRTRPRAWLFLLDAALFATLAVSLVLTLLRGWSWVAFFILLLQVSLVIGGVRLFRKFRGVTPAPAGAES